MASIMSAAAAQNPYSCAPTYRGPALNGSAVRELALTVAQPLYSAITMVSWTTKAAASRGGQIRSLGLLDDLRYAAIIFTSSEKLRAEIPSRVKPQLFSAHGIFGSATNWLLDIAGKENIPLFKPNA